MMLKAIRPLSSNPLVSAFPWLHRDSREATGMVRTAGEMEEIGVEVREWRT